MLNFVKIVGKRTRDWLLCGIAKIDDHTVHNMYPKAPSNKVAIGKMYKRVDPRSQHVHTQ